MSCSLPPGFTVLQVTPALNTGGVEQTTLDMAEAVAGEGGRALVASAGGRLEPELASRGGVLVRMPLDTKNPLAMWRNSVWLAALIRRERVSLVHARSRAPAYSALWAARTCRVPFVTTYHGVYGARSALKRSYNSVMARGDLVIANSEFTRTHLLAEHRVDPAKVIVIPRGVDLVDFDPQTVSQARVSALRQTWGLAPDEGRVVVLLAGRLTSWKGQALLIEAVRRMVSWRRSADGAEAQTPRFVVILAGDDQGRNAFRAELVEAIAQAGLTDMVKLVGHCADMPAAYLACDVAVAPSLSPEAFGRTAVEPQAMGRPVLAADHGAARETVVEGETGWRVRPGDPEAWANALRVATSLAPAARIAMGLSGQARVRRLYSLQAMTAATLDVYARVLRERPT